jgi:predicted nucleic acid-binding protein
MSAIADSSFVVALAIKSDRNRHRCLPIFERENFIYLPQSVLNEVCYFLTRTGGNRATSNFLKQLPDTKYVLAHLEDWDINRTADLLAQYVDSRIDYVDASVAAVAERLNITRILTLDRRDFSIIRPNHTPHFEILPQ